MVDATLTAIRALLESRQRDGTTHYAGCEIEHIDCAAWWMLERLERATEPFCRECGDLAAPGDKFCVRCLAELELE